MNLASNQKLIIDAVLSNKYFYSQFGFQSHKTGMVDNCEIDELEKLNFIRTNDNGSISILYEIALTSATGVALSNNFIDIQRPTQEELVMFKLQYGIDYDSNKVGGFIDNNSDIFK